MYNTERISKELELLLPQVTPTLGYIKVISYSRPFTTPLTIITTFSKYTFDIHYLSSFYTITSLGYIFITLSLATVFI